MDDRQQLGVIAQSRSLPHGVVRRVQIVLLLAHGESNSAIARRFKLSVPTIGHWRQLVLEHGVAGLYSEARRGRPRYHVHYPQTHASWLN
jgi:transposase